VCTLTLSSAFHYYSVEKRILIFSDDNKDLGLKVKELDFKAKTKAQGLESQGQGQGLETQGPGQGLGSQGQGLQISRSNFSPVFLRRFFTVKVL